MLFSRIYLYSALLLICGVAVGALLTTYFNHQKYEDYHRDQVQYLERMSYDFHQNQEPNSSSLVQLSYLIYIYRAWKIGVLNNDLFHLNQAIILLRMCIAKEKSGKDYKASKLCAHAIEALHKWDDSYEFDKFREIVNKEDFQLSELSDKYTTLTIENEYKYIGKMFKEIGWEFYLDPEHTPIEDFSKAAKERKAIRESQSNNALKNDAAKDSGSF